MKGESGLDAASMMLTIGELAARAGVTAEAIRYYEREGVVPAAARGGPGRYRRYKEADMVRLRSRAATASCRSGNATFSAR
jgi:DNA-binding transcriptional MerR regulator